jgi:uncharacterized protein with GYD domain
MIRRPGRQDGGLPSAPIRPTRCAWTASTSARSAPAARYPVDATSLTTGAACAFAGARDREHVGQEGSMTIYISQRRYTAAAIRAMTAKPEDRSAAIAEMLAAAGGRLISWYFTLGRYDWLIVARGTRRAYAGFGCTCRGCWRKPVRHHHDRGTHGREYG